MGLGFASKNINPGEHVHSHNLEFKDFDRKFKVFVILSDFILSFIDFIKN